MSLDNPIKPSYAAVELEDGTAFSGVRVTFQSRRALERTMKAQGWSTDDNVFTISAFLAWHASKKAGKHQLSWDAFLNALVDCELRQPGDTTPEEAADVDDELSPTQPAAITG